jgi:GT2 family glycosyltransferase
VNSDAAPADDTPVPACLIGERVLLVGEGSAARQPHLESSERGRIEFTLADRQFVALACSTPIDLAAIADILEIEDGILAFAAAAGLERESWGQLCAILFGTVAKAFALGRDGHFAGCVEEILAEPSLPRGGLAAETVSGFDTMLLNLPRSFGLAPDDLLVSCASGVSVGTVRLVRDWLDRGRGGRIASVRFPSTPEAGLFLAVSPRGLAVLDIETERQDGSAAFHGRHHRASPELVSILSLSDAEAAGELAVLDRRAVISDTIDDRTIGFQLHLADVLPMPHGLFVHGWLFDPDQRLQALTAVDYSLRDTMVSRAWHLVPATLDTDGERRRVMRFTAFLPRVKGAATPGNATFRVDLAGGERHLLLAAAGAQDDRSRRSRILDSIAGRDFPPDVFRRIHKPALGPLQAALNRRQAIRKRADFGAVSSRSTSIVVPLYRETRFIRSQLMAFARDAHIRDHCEIVYVLDDPMITLKVEHELRGHGERLPLDIRLVVLERNGGYALANNFGVRSARGETIVLMNSDVVPEGPGWLEALTSVLAALPAGSAVGPKLLYADGSLQHAGMYFERGTTGAWQNMHYFKGYGRDFGPAGLERDVPALTGALMVLRRADYLAVDGLDANYVIGDFEDSDLCLKLRARGGRCRYVSSVALLHFERQSMPEGAGAGPSGSTLYNEALHHQRWSSSIETLMTDFAGVPHG